MKLTYSPQKGKPGHCMVAQVWADGRNAAEIEPTDEPAEATSLARMFAAAPDLLAACESAAGLLRRIGGSNYDPEYSGLLAAIAKAKAG